MTHFLICIRYNTFMTIYLDIIFLENIFMNTIILFATSIILKNKINIIRILISSSIGSLYAVLTYVTTLGIFSNIFLKIILSIAMIYVAFKPNRIKQMLKLLMIFYLASFTFGGVAFALVYFVKPQNILLEKRSINWNISDKNSISRWNNRFYNNNYCFQNY